MKLFLDQLATENAEHIHVAQELQKRHEIVYWIRMEHIALLDKSKFPGTIFHNYQDAVNGIPPKEIDASAFAPWSRNDIIAFSEWETEILSMMDKWYPEWPVNQRKDFYNDLLRYWGGVLDQCAPDCVVFNAPPHQMFNFVLYAIAKHRGIKTILFDGISLKDRLILYNDYKIGNETLVNASKHGFGDHKVLLSDLKPYLQEYYRWVSESPDPSPPYVAEFTRMISGWPRWRKRLVAYWPFVKDGSIFERAVLRIFKMLKPDLKNIYKRCSKDADLNKPFIYIPLHFQPECTTSPQGGIYVNQLLMIKTLAMALPEGWELYIKEHHGQWKINGGDFVPFRYRGFYEEIVKLPNVRLIPIGTNTFRLCDSAKATATVTGTAGWESILRGKCALVFGYPWYAQAPGVIRVGSVEDCRNAFRKIIDGYKPDKSLLFKYLALLDEVSFSGFHGASSGRVKIVGGEEQWMNLYRTIEHALESRKFK